MKKFISLSLIAAFILVSNGISQATVIIQGSPNGSSTIIYSTGTCYNPYICTKCLDCEDDYACFSYAVNSPSTIMNGAMRYYTWSHDYVSADAPSGCSPCGTSGSSAGSDLPKLSITRFFEPESYTREHLTFGALHGMETYDQRLTFTAGHTALIVDDYGTQVAKRGLDFNAARLCWIENNGRRDVGVASVHLFDAAGLPVTTAATRNTAHTATRLNYDGSTVHFEILWDANGTGVGRPIAFLDRYGNAIEIEYVDAHPVFGTPATESFRPYFRKTLMRDAYGRVANFTYTKLFQRYVATRIDLPNGENITYQYIWNGGVQLEKVIHPDGTESLFQRTVNTTTKLDEFTILDAKSESGHRRKRIYLAQGQGFAEGGGVISTTRSRVRRAQNGEGEFVWDSRFPQI